MPRHTTSAATTLAGLLIGTMVAGCSPSAMPQGGQVPSLSPSPTPSIGQPSAPPSPPTLPPAPAPAPDQPSEATPIPLPLADAARGALEELPIKGRAPKTGYEREQFGQRWSDDVVAEFGHNGCDTRNDILGRDLINKEYKPNTRDCVVLAGQLSDPYTGTLIEFRRGQRTSSAVQIDHVVALSDAWQKGAQQLTPEQRQEFANDPLNLLAVDGPANQQKRDGDAATWIPPNSAFRCQYVARQVSVKKKYSLWVTPAERDAIARWLNTCTPEDEAGLENLQLAPTPPI
ncbi:HNH endonuclease family protein [Corynebacterium lactis]|uniref:Calcium-binding protein n=1 Tax=Corynebacterium lactis RW2-5 TaxID=1408189 RepID=A0A0K2GXC2_9CORY|nr:HNH endonuclease family protein [Corynebacterium lactis]ALA66430.1 calcium-binding protein [Corynebacterium lactis RW2-5]